MHSKSKADQNRYTNEWINRKSIVLKQFSLMFCCWCDLYLQIDDGADCTVVKWLNA